MSRRPKSTQAILLMTLLILYLAGCAGGSEVIPSTAQPNPALLLVPSLTASPTITPTSIPASTPTITPTPRVLRSIDLVAWQSGRDGVWFSENLDAFPQVQLMASASFDIQETPIDNRRDGRIAPTLVSGYVFMQFGEITPTLFSRHAHTIRAFFIRSALLSFVDYQNNHVLDWEREAVNIPINVRELIRVCNQKQIPVFLEINYSDYVPGPLGTGVDALQPADNIAGTIAFLNALEAEGLYIEGITFGDEIDDDAGFGDLKPTLGNSDLVGRFISYARAIKSEFPELKVYAFDSYIAATRGLVSLYWDYFERIRQAEIEDDMILLDGFVFRESYTYMDEEGQILDSQYILDDIESLYRDVPLYRYDVMGVRHEVQNRDYLHQIIDETDRIFGRTIDIGLTEYLPAGPIQIDESDTSPYDDMDFIIHYSDVVGIYAELGLDTVSAYMFANSNDQAKAYVDKRGMQGLNYPIHAQLAGYFAGDILEVVRSTGYDKLKVKVYAARQDDEYFIMILNKDVTHEAIVKVTLPGQFDLTLRLPRRSYTSLLIEENNITVSGIGD